VAKIVGFSAGAVGRMGNVDRMVQALLEKSGAETEFVKLADLSYSGCKGCVQLCARPQVCMLKDDVQPYCQQVKDADAVVIGAPVYFDTINAMAASFVERFFGYRHVDIPIAGKPFVLVIAGAMGLDSATKLLRGTLERGFKANILDVVHFQSETVPCFKCGRHRECEIGGLYAMVGEQARETTITPDMFKQWEDNPEAVAAVARSAEALRAV
jgi:NAD(P)H-dependent FMN reductase